MTVTDTPDADAAADWALRLAADAAGARAMGAGDWAALTAWLEGGEARRDALEAAERLLELDLPPLAAPGRGAVERWRAPRRATWAAGGLAAVAACVGAVALVAPWRGAGAERVYLATASAPLRVGLDDGSTVLLNRGARLEATMRGGARRVVLSPGGEALFDVRRDPARPFVVRAGGDEVRVLGTLFDVDAAAAGLRVAVARGAVAVSLASAPGRTWRVPAGFRLAQAKGGPAVVPAASESVGAWRDGVLVYEGTPLSQVAADLSRYWGRPVVAEGELAARPFTGTLAIDTPQAMARRLALFAALTVDVEPGRTVLRTRRPRP